MSLYSCKILAVSLPPSLSHHRPWYWSLFLKYFFKTSNHVILLLKTFHWLPRGSRRESETLNPAGRAVHAPIPVFLAPFFSQHCFLLISPPRNSQLFIVTSSPVVCYFTPRYCIFILFLYMERPSPFPSPGKHYSCFKTYNRCYIPSFLLNRI